MIRYLLCLLGYHKRDAVGHSHGRDWSYCRCGETWANPYSHHWVKRDSLLGECLCIGAIYYGE